MLPMTVFQRLRLLILFFLWWITCYVIIQKVTVHFPFALPILTLPGEAGIPFYPEWLPIYTSLYAALPLFYLMFDRRNEVLKIIAAFGVCSTLHFMIFMLLPVRYVLRPDFPAEQSIFHQAIALIYFIDEPLNTFPSMHVSFSFLMYFSVREFKPRHSTLLLLFAIIVSVSTVIVKQHYILDVIFAIALSYLVYLIAIRQEKKISLST